MFDDLIKPKPTARYHKCISCGRVLKTGETCPDCNPKASGEQLNLWDDDDLWTDWGSVREDSDGCEMDCENCEDTTQCQPTGC